MSEFPAHRDTDDLPAVSPADVDTTAAGPGGLYEAVVVSYDDAPDECTVFPVDVGEAELVTTWVSAAEGSFVYLATMR